MREAVPVPVQHVVEDSVVLVLQHRSVRDVIKGLQLLSAATTNLDERDDLWLRWRDFELIADLILAADDLENDQENEEPPGIQSPHGPQTVRQLAEATGLSTTFLNRTCREGKLLATKDERGQWVVDAATATGFIEDCTRRRNVREFARAYPNANIIDN